MTAFRTCKNCVLEKAPCVRREAVRTAIVGAGVTSVKMLCKDRKPLYSAGQRVTVTWLVPDPDDSYCTSPNQESWAATVISESGPKFLIKVDDADSDLETPARSYVKNPTLYAKVSACKLRPLAEPAQVVCETCGRVGTGLIGEGGCHGYQGQEGYSRLPGYTPRGCIALPTPADQEGVEQP